MFKHFVWCCPDLRFSEALWKPRSEAGVQVPKAADTELVPKQRICRSWHTEEGGAGASPVEVLIQAQMRAITFWPPSWLAVGASQHLGASVPVAVPMC